MPSFSEVQEALAARPTSATPPGIAPEAWAQHLRGSRMVASQMGDLIRGSEWPTYAAHLTRLRNEDQQRLETLQGALATGDAVGDTLTQQKLAAREVAGALRVWDLVLAMPQMLIDADAKMQPPAAPVVDHAMVHQPPPAPPAVRTTRVTPKARGKKRHR